MDNPETWGSISGIDRVHDPRFEGGRLVGFSFDTRVAGKAYAGNATPNGRREGQSIGWHIENSEVKGRVRVDLEPAGDDTTITVDLMVESKGMMSTMFFPVIAGTVGNGLPRTVDEFAASFGG